MDISRGGWGLGCRVVSLTPIYDQLRGERINADVPASAPDLGPMQRRTSTGAAADVAPIFGRPRESRAQHVEDQQRVRPATQPVGVD